MTVTFSHRDGRLRAGEEGESWDILLLDDTRVPMVPRLAGTRKERLEPLVSGQRDQEVCHLAVLAHEGTYPIMYGPIPLPIGTAHRTAYLARPDEAGTFPVVIVIPDLGGMDSFEKDLCRRLARSGLAAIAIDLYRADDEPLVAYNELTDSRAITDLEETYEFIMSDDVAWNAGNRVGLLGVDVGGRFAIIQAARSTWVGSIALAYTPLTGDEGRDNPVANFIDHLPVPVLALYGADDDLIASASVDEAQNRNHHGQWLLYEDTGHGFLDPTSDGYNQAAADDAIARLIAFFQATLPDAEIEDLG